jgi:hypothetical protein
MALRDARCEVASPAYWFGADWRLRPPGLRLTVLVGTLLVSGCADSLFYTQLNAPLRPLLPRPIAAVETFALKPPARAHTEVGLIQVIRFSNDGDLHEMIASLRARAAEIGCDAILITSIDRRAPSIQASCIVYNDPSAIESDGPGAPIANHEAPKPSSRLAVVGTSPGEVRTAPYLVAPLVTRLEPGQRVWVSSDATNGWRVVTLSDGRTGYIPDAAIRLE